MTKKIAICQLNPIAGEPEKNIETIENTIQESVKKGIKLIIFPEDFLFGVLKDRRSYVKKEGRRFDFWINKLKITANNKAV